MLMMLMLMMRRRLGVWRGCQALGAVKAGRALLVLLAPDTEESEALDGKLGALQHEARDRGVPVVACLSRRCVLLLCF